MADRRRRKPVTGTAKDATAVPTSAGDAAPAIFRIKVISIGDALAGKSCLIKRFCEGKFVTRYISTIGIDYGVKPVDVDGRNVRVNFWDLSGHPDFLDVRNEFYKDTQGMLVVYDVSNRPSFDRLDQWMAEAGEYGARKVPSVVCANKVDKKRVVTEAEGRAWAERHGMLYIETSANTGQNVQEAFDALLGRVVKYVDAAKA